MDSNKIKLQTVIDEYMAKRAKKGFASKLSKFEMFTIRLEYLLRLLDIMYEFNYITISKTERVKKIKGIKQHAFSSKNKHGKFNGMSKEEIDYLAETWKLYTNFLKDQSISDEEIKELLTITQ